MRHSQNHYLRFYKRPFGLVLASLLLILLSPLLAIIALAIKLDSPGPVLFRQQRTGYLGRRFELLKFRTMIRDAEQQKDQLRDLNIHGYQSPDFKVRDDPRITRVGGFLRRTSLDELPNLINVVRGEMALVGPRPTSFEATTYAPHQLARLAVRPGVTGLWQISGRSDLDFCTRTALDIDYINRASWWLDLHILLLTPFRAGKGAY
ncbi:MAG: sugar transferase [Halochromatium sp.]|nr:sugar transferase [Halochromatium sp.]